MLAEQFNFDKQKVMLRLKHVLIAETYSAAHTEGRGINLCIYHVLIVIP
jgi:hypothetical protein